MGIEENEEMDEFDTVTLEMNSIWTLKSSF